MEVKNESEELKVLKEILKWTKIQGIDKVKQIMINEFSDEKKRLVYSLSDGRSSDDIEKMLNKRVSDVSIRNWWKSWAKMGIMELHPDYKKRYIKLFNLEDFGIELPDNTQILDQKEINKTSEKMELLKNAEEKPGN